MDSLQSVMRSTPLEAHKKKPRTQHAFEIVCTQQCRHQHSRSSFTTTNKDNGESLILPYK
eukprot:m.16053 g.16053  ORF g.16053 m.16053 type:complete len:60 (-) comp7991_c0_seq1:305-484(-)